ncbi:MAG: ribosomal-processing cysteine protease Prp [bacterium]
MILIEKEKEVIKINGHAMYDDFGKDIVCASVSSIIYTSVNGILSFDSKSIEFIDNKHMEIRIKKNTKEVEVLIQNMFNLLEELEREYPKNLKIIK